AVGRHHDLAAAVELDHVLDQEIGDVGDPVQGHGAEIVERARVYLEHAAVLDLDGSDVFGRFVYVGGDEPAVAIDDEVRMQVGADAVDRHIAVARDCGALDADEDVVGRAGNRVGAPIRGGFPIAVAVVAPINL